MPAKHMLQNVLTLEPHKPNAICWKISRRLQCFSGGSAMSSALVVHPAGDFRIEVSQPLVGYLLTSAASHSTTTCSRWVIWRPNPRWL